MYARQSPPTDGAHFSLMGIDWWERVSVPVAAYEDWIVKRMAIAGTTTMEVNVRDQGEWLKVLQNIASLATASEEVFFPVVEAAYGSGFAWYDRAIAGP